MAFAKMPEVLVKMTVHDCAELLCSYAPVGVSVWYSPAVKKIIAGLRTTDKRDMIIDTSSMVDLDETLDKLFDLPYNEKGAPEQ